MDVLVGWRIRWQEKRQAKRIRNHELFNLEE